MSAWNEDDVYYICQRSSDGEKVPVLNKPPMTYRQAIDYLDEVDPENELKLYIIHEDSLKLAAGKV